MGLVFDNEKIPYLYESILRIVDPISSYRIYRCIVDEVCKFFDLDYGAIFIAKASSLVRVYSTNPLLYKLPAGKNSYSYRAYVNQKIYVLGEEEIKKIDPDILKDNTKSLIIVPLSYKKNCLGVLLLRSSKAFYFDHGKIDILKLFASVAALKIRNSFLRNEVKKQLKIREQFAAIASHQLKTPLTIISLYTQLIENKFKTQKPIKDQWFGTIQKQVDKMTSIIEEFLAIKKIKNRKLKYKWENVNICSLIKQVINNYTVTNPDRIIKLESKICNETKVKVWGDKNKLDGVFVNIINNAIKYSIVSSVIFVTLELKKDKVYLKFKDQGSGIRKKDLPYIFEPFFRGGKLKKSGSGIGLFLSKNVIIDHRGDISVQSKFGSGTTLEIKLPIL